MDEGINKEQATESEIKDGKVVETAREKKEDLTDEKVKIKRHKFDSLNIYEVTESELETLEKGSPSSIYFNFSIFLLSVAISFFASLLTNDYTNKQSTFIIFLVITIVGFVIGIFLLILWLRTKNSFNEIIQKVKDRME